MRYISYFTKEKLILMNSVVQIIPLNQLLIALIPVLLVLWILVRWSLNATYASYALLRMLGQLLLIGYFLNNIFAVNAAWIVLAISAVMLFSASWIALGTLKAQRWQLYRHALGGIGLGGGFTLALITQGVMDFQPWYAPQYFIPIAGMIFANSMTSVSLAADRLDSELQRGVDYLTARNQAFHAAMIPVINSLFAVGLVSLPGMMTGQILSGIEPFIAARYQIMVMCMVFGSAGLATAYFLVFSKDSWKV